MATFSKFQLHRLLTKPERLQIVTEFEVAAGKTVRLVKVDNLTLEIIECFYREENEQSGTAVKIDTLDEFTFPHSTVSAEVNVHIVDGANNPVSSMNTADAPPIER